MLLEQEAAVAVCLVLQPLVVLQVLLQEIFVKEIMDRWTLTGSKA